MDVRSLSAEEIKAARERLASRKSFFGGSISTRAEAADPGFKARAQAASETSQRTHSKPERPKSARDSGQQTRKPAVKRPRDSGDDFGNLDDNDPLPPKPAGSIKTSKAGDVWGQYIAAKRRKEEAQQGSGAKQRQTRPGMQSKPPAIRSRPVQEERQRSPGADRQRAAGSAPGRISTASGSFHTSRASVTDGGQRAAAYDEEDDLGDFIDDDLGGEDWRLELQSVTGYDPSKFAPVRDDRRMVASKVDIEREERQSKRAGRQEDDKAEEEERRLRALKEAKREKHRSKSRKGGSGLLLMD